MSTKEIALEKPTRKYIMELLKCTIYFLYTQLNELMRVGCKYDSELADIELYFSDLLVFLDDDGFC